MTPGSPPLGRGLISAARITVPFAIYIAVQLIAEAVTGSTVLAAIVGALAVIMLFPVYLRFAPTKQKDRSAPADRSAAGLLLITGTLLLVWFAGQVLAVMIWQVWPETHAAYDVRTQQLKEVPGAVMLTLALVLAPVAEEILFRGVLFRELRDGTRLSNVIAALLSALVFSVIHGNAVQFAATLMFGVLLAFAYELTATIWVPIAMHIAFNVLATFVPVSVVRAFLGPVQVVTVLILAVFAVLAFGLRIATNAKTVPAAQRRAASRP